MSDWADRPREEAHLFNPSFLCLLVCGSAAGYNETTGDGLPFQLAFLALPLSLHKATRDALPRDLRTSMAAWLQQNARFRVGFVERSKSLAPLVREAVLFGATHGMISLDGRGHILLARSPTGLSRYRREVTDEVRDCLKRSEFVGRWFGEAGTPTTVMALWGVKP